MTRLSFGAFRAFGAAVAVALGLSVAAVAAVEPAPSGPCDGCFGVVTVGRSGTAANCTTASIQDAINRAKLPEWADEVWITNDVLGGEYRVGTINISNQTVEIVGGFDDCSDVTPGGFTTISGAGGDTNSVFTIRGNSNVGMTGLIVTGGDDGLDDDGGGIDFKGGGNLTLAKMRILGNFAGYGGGVFAEGSSLNVNMLNDVLISDNVAVHDGGGVYLDDGATLNMTGVNVGIHRNTAQGFSGGGYGGGLHVRNPADAEISATGFPDGLGGEYPVFADNTALYGGAIAVMGAEDFGGQAVVRVSPGVSGGPFVFIRNKAANEGGAIYSGAYAEEFPQDTESSGTFCAYDTAFRDNIAPEGAAIYYDSASDFSGENAQGMLSLNGGPGCGGPTVRRCAAGNVCNEFSGNRTQTLDTNLRTDGAIVEFEGSIGRFESRGSLFKNNIGGTLVHMGDGNDGSLLNLLNCVFLNNNLSRPTVDSAADKSVIRHCTIADNVLLGQHVLRIVESGATGVDHLASITNSIIFQPGEISLDLGGAAVQTIITHVMASEIASLKPESAFGTVFDGNPQFANPAGGDYRPSALSDAVDYAPTLLPDGNDDGFVNDALRFSRSVDLPTLINVTGFRDLGAFELQAGTIIPPDSLFLDGFEN